jgi:peptidyl-prolyl cis-trans isomerase C
MNLNMHLTIRRFPLSIIIFLSLSFLSSCNNRISNIATPTSTISIALPTSTPSQVPPSLTPIPLAARVNEEGITLAQYQAELERYKASVGTELATQDQQKLLDDLINQVLLAQSAEKEGFVADEQMVQEHIDQLIVQLGSEQSLDDWMKNNSFTPDTFKLDLKLSLEAAWMRDQVVAKVPDKAEQVHARQILLYNSAQAEDALTQLKAGKNFTELAVQYDPVTYGDLGWFPRGYLLNKDLEDVAFSLEPGNYSNVIKTDAGYHILLVVEKDPQHPLEPDALLTLQSQAVKNWLQQKRSQSKIEILLP